MVALAAASEPIDSQPGRLRHFSIEFLDVIEECGQLRPQRLK